MGVPSVEKWNGEWVPSVEKWNGEGIGFLL